jgi:hypothetical protein
MGSVGAMRISRLDVSKAVSYILAVMDYALAYYKQERTSPLASCSMQRLLAHPCRRGLGLLRQTPAFKTALDYNGTGSHALTVLLHIACINSILQTCFVNMENISSTLQDLTLSGHTRLAARRATIDLPRELRDIVYKQL